MISNLLVRPSTALPWLLITLGLLTSSTTSGTSCPSGYECMTVWGRRYSPWVQLEDFFPRPGWNMNGGGASEQSDGAAAPPEPTNPRDKDGDGKIDCLYYLYDYSKGRVPMGDGYGTIRKVHPTTGERNVPHNGIDQEVPNGTTLYAAKGGRVSEVVRGVPENRPGEVGVGGGNMVVIEHSDNTESVYLHMRSTELNVGDIVAVGDEVGLSNNSGGSTGPHLHFAVRKANWSSYPKEGRTRNLNAYINPEDIYDSCASGGGSSPGIDASDIGNG